MERTGPPKTGTHTKETGQACMRRNTAPAEDHHQHLLNHCTTTATPHTATSTEMREKKERNKLVFGERRIKETERNELQRE